MKTHWLIRPFLGVIKPPLITIGFQQLVDHGTTSWLHLHSDVGKFRDFLRASEAPFWRNSKFFGRWESTKIHAIPQLCVYGSYVFNQFWGFLCQLMSLLYIDVFNSWVNNKSPKTRFFFAIMALVYNLKFHVRWSKQRKTRRRRMGLEEQITQNPFDKMLFVGEKTHEIEFLRVKVGSFF